MTQMETALRTLDRPERLEAVFDKLKAMSEVVCMSNGRERVHVFYGSRCDIEDRNQAPLVYHVFWMGEKSSKRPPTDSPWLAGCSSWKEEIVIYTWILPERSLVRDLLKKNFGIDAKFAETAN